MPGIGGRPRDEKPDDPRQHSIIQQSMGRPTGVNPWDFAETALLRGPDNLPVRGGFSFLPSTPPAEEFLRQPSPGYEAATLDAALAEVEKDTRLATPVSVPFDISKLTVSAVKTASATAKADEITRVNSTSAAITITMPDSASSPAGSIVIVKSINTTPNIITVSPAGSDTVDDGTGMQILDHTGILGFCNDRVNRNWINVYRSAHPPQVYRVTDVKTGNYTAALQEIVLVDPTGGGFNVTLPLTTSGQEYTKIHVKNIGTSTNTVTILPSGSEKIDGKNSVSITAGNNSLGMLNNRSRSEWLVLWKVS